MANETSILRRCIGSERFGIEPHEAPVEDFPKQPSQKDGFGRMCKLHWNVYTAHLARDAKARKAAEASTAIGLEAGTAAEPERPAKRTSGKTPPVGETLAEVPAEPG